MTELARLPASFFLAVYLRVAQLGGAGLVSLGLAGVLAEPASWLFGVNFIAGDQRLRQFTPERCAYLTDPRLGQPDCATGAVYQAFGETVTYGIVVTAFGFLVWGAHTLWLHRTAPGPYDRFLRRAYLTAAAVVFLAGASLFLPLGISQTLSAPNLGAGRPLLTGLVAAAFLVGYAWRLWRELQPREAASR